MTSAWSRPGSSWSSATTRMPPILEELSREDGEDTEAWYLRGLCLMMLARGKEAREALLRARALVEENPTRDAGLTAQIDQLLARRALSQAEREAVWNPRWWVQDGRAQRAPTGPEPALTRPGDLVVVHNEEDLIDLSPAAQESRAQANGGRGTAGSSCQPRVTTLLGP